MSLSENLLEDDGGEEEPLATFNAKQVHLGFCPEDVILEIRPTSLVLCDDDRPVVEYPFINLVMWSQHQHRVMLMTQDNLRRIVLRARSARDAKKIVKKLHELTEDMSKEAARRELLGLSSVDMTASSMGRSSDSMTRSRDKGLKSRDLPQLMSTDHGDIHKRDKHNRLVRPSMTMSGGDSMDEMQTLDFREEVGEHLEEFRVFHVQQSYLTKSVCHETSVMLRIDRTGLTVFTRHTGVEVDRIEWFQLLMWKADDSAIVLVTTGTNRQIRLMTAAAEDVLKTLVQYATSVRESMELRKAQVGFRKELLAFKPVKFKTHDAWTKARKQTGLMRRLPWASTENLSESLHTREQLHAVFSLYDTTASGSLTSSELLALLKSLHLEIAASDLQDIMDDMEANGNQEVEFDGFVAWVLSSSQGAGASTTLRRRIAHKKKEVDTLLRLFEQIDTDGEQPCFLLTMRVHIPSAYNGMLLCRERNHGQARVQGAA